MQTDPPNLGTVLDALRVQVENLRKLAALNPDDPVYARSAEQVEAIVTELESRAAPTFGSPVPPSPG
jgi:hypothetical protein